MNAPVDITNIHIETDRLILRPWMQSDLEDFFAYASVEGVGEKAGWHHHECIADSQRILDMFIEQRKVFALELKENGRVIGSLGLEYMSDDLDVPDGSQGRELGYVLSKEYWGRGLMPEAVEAVIQYCFKEWSFDWVTCSHFAGNNSSARVIEKCGFYFLFKEELVLASEQKCTVLTYIRYNPYKESNHV